MADNRTAERYAYIKPTWEGFCPLMMPDGLCALHKEYGEKILPSVCRYFPRAPRNKYSYECSCANSCEKTLETLFSMQQPLTFEQRELSFDFAEILEFHGGDKSNVYNKLREICFTIMQDRSIPLSERLHKLGVFSEEAKSIPLIKLEAEIERLMDRCDKLVPYTCNDTDCVEGFIFIRKIAEWFMTNTVSLNEYAEEIENVFNASEGKKNYLHAKERFSKLFPKWEIMFENMLINHVFYEQFPFAEGINGVWEAFTALSGVYAFVRYLALGYMFNKESIEDLIDICVSAFRVIEHSPFYKKANIMLKGEGLNSLSSLLPIINV